jgi:hypothetical protein
MADLHAHRPADVDRFLAELDHPLKAEMIALRAIITGVERVVKEIIRRTATTDRTGGFSTTGVCTESPSCRCP